MGPVEELEATPEEEEDIKASIFSRPSPSPTELKEPSEGKFIDDDTIIQSNRSSDALDDSVASKDDEIESNRISNVDGEMVTGDLRSVDETVSDEHIESEEDTSPSVAVIEDTSKERKTEETPTEKSVVNFVDPVLPSSEETNPSNVESEVKPDSPVKEESSEINSLSPEVSHVESTDTAGSTDVANKNEPKVSLQSLLCMLPEERRTSLSGLEGIERRELMQALTTHVRECMGLMDMITDLST